MSICSDNSACNSLKCENNGYCDETPDMPVCVCPTGVGGALCDVSKYR